MSIRDSSREGSAHPAEARTAHVIWNPVAGSGDAGEELTRLRAELEPAFSLVIHETTPERDAASLARAAVEGGAELVLAGGGDGTVSAVAGALIGTGVRFGVIPRGTANAFAACVLGDAVRFDRIGVAVAAIRGGQTRTIDCARANGVPMVQLVGLGLEAGMVAAADREQKDTWGVLAYLQGGLRQLRIQKPFRVHLEADGESHHFDAVAVVIANAAPVTSLFAQGQGPPIFDDGLLDVTVVAPFEGGLDALAALGELAGAALIEGETGERVAHVRARRVVVDTDPPQRLALDGELVGWTPVEVECIPGALEVLVAPAVSTPTEDELDPQLPAPPRWSLAGPYLGAAALLMSAGALLGGVAWVLAWPAASLALAAIGYLGLGPGVLGKRGDGTRAPVLGFLSLPFRWLSSLRWYVRLASAEPAFHRVSPTLYVGRRPRRGELPRDVDLVVDVTAELDRLADRQVAYRCLPSLDFAQPDEAPFRELLAGVGAGQTLYVHCAAGHGRSAMVAAAFLVHRGEARDVDEAYERLVNARPTVRKNRWQARLARRVVGERPTDV